MTSPAFSYMSNFPPRFQNLEYGIYFFPQKSGVFTQKKLMTANFKSSKESLRWYCQICALTFISKKQAQDHFFGKRHQNVARNKDFYNPNPILKTALQIGIEKKDFVERLQNASKSSFNQSCQSCSPEDDDIPPPVSRDNILETVLKSERKTFYSSDLSIYRTPSGKYYCQPCNVTVNSQVQFLQHLESKKHKYKANKTSLRAK